MIGQSLDGITPLMIKNPETVVRGLQIAIIAITAALTALCLLPGALPATLFRGY
jgi:hypothetical protein